MLIRWFELSNVKMFSRVSPNKWLEIIIQDCRLWFIIVGGLHLILNTGSLEVKAIIASAQQGSAPVKWYYDYKSIKDFCHRGPSQKGDFLEK